MGTALYVANLDARATPEELRALFAAHGEIAALEITIAEGGDQPVGVVEMASEKHATRALNTLNGNELRGKRLYVSYLVPDLDKDVTPRQRQTVDEIAALLEETEKIPLRQIEAIVCLCGGRFAQALAEEALLVEAQEGLMTADGTRRRTKGGIFFYLARFRMSLETRRIIFNRKGKLPGRQYD